MLVIKKRRYKKQHVIGGSGIFDNIVKLAKNIFSSSAAKTVALSAAKQAGKHIVDKILAPKSSPLHTSPTAQVAPTVMTQKSKDDLMRLISQEPGNINNLMMGNGTNPRGVVSIQELVKRLNGSGMKVV